MQTRQNTSTAVMQRRAEPSDSLDYFPTPPWATRALCEYLGHFFKLKAQSVWEPACGEGHMAMPLSEYFKDVYATDVFDYSAAFPGQATTRDFVLGWGESEPAPAVDWVITNPPFRLAEEFIDTSMKRARIGCAMLVRTSFLEGVGRYKRLYSRNWPVWVLQFSERVPMFKGRLDPAGASATSYCWIIWVNRPERKKRPVINGTPPQFSWIAPCRKSLERPGDYPKAIERATPSPLFETLGDREGQI